jgi:hypothetical protein
LIDQEDVADHLRLYYRKYPGRNYGGGFSRWAAHPEAGPYNSAGSGAAMRASPCGYAATELSTVLLVAERMTDITHNHPEGIRGAKAVAASVFLARNGATKEDIAAYVTQELGYNLTRSADELRAERFRSTLCPWVVPTAIRAFLESTDFEDCVRLAVSIGGDSDTIACIAGAIAEPFYGGVPGHIQAEVYKRLDRFIPAVIFEFRDKLFKQGFIGHGNGKLISSKGKVRIYEATGDASIYRLNEGIHIGGITTIGQKLQELEALPDDGPKIPGPRKLNISPEDKRFNLEGHKIMRAEMCQQSTGRPWPGYPDDDPDLYQCEIYPYAWGKQIVTDNRKASTGTTTIGQQTHKARSLKMKTFSADDPFYSIGYAVQMQSTGKSSPNTKEKEAENQSDTLAKQKEEHRKKAKIPKDMYDALLPTLRMGMQGKMTEAFGSDETDKKQEESSHDKE